MIVIDFNIHYEYPNLHVFSSVYENRVTVFPPLSSELNLNYMPSSAKCAPPYNYVMKVGHSQNIRTRISDKCEWRKRQNGSDKGTVRRIEIGSYSTSILHIARRLLILPLQTSQQPSRFQTFWKLSQQDYVMSFILVASLNCSSGRTAEAVLPGTRVNIIYTI